MKIFKPSPELKGKFYHKGTGFRQMIDLWERLGKVEVEESPDGYCWLHEPNKILLYDRDTLDWLDPNLEYEVGLFANPNPPNNGKDNRHWIYWGRYPEILENYSRKKNIPIINRKIDSCFIGNFENAVQSLNRRGDWDKVIDLFSCTYSTTHTYTPIEYMDIMRNTKIGLSLVGFGPKCNRDVEILAFGCIPVFTKKHNLNYCFDLKGLEQFTISSEEDFIRLKTDLLSDNKQITELSALSREIYKNHLSIEGSFQTTLQALT